jgi:dolichol kinase
MRPCGACLLSPFSSLVLVPPMPASLRHELARKSIHVATVVVPLAYARGVARGVVLAGLGFLLLVALLVELARVRSAWVGATFTRAVGGMLREHERLRWSGATWMLLAFVLAAALFPRDVAAAAMCAVSLGDAAAAVFGRALGRTRLVNGKTLEGAAACALATAAGAALVARLGAAECVVAGLCAAAAELPARPLDDNVRVALATGAGILLWRMTFY